MGDGSLQGLSVTVTDGVMQNAAMHGSRKGERTNDALRRVEAFQGVFFFVLCSAVLAVSGEYVDQST